MPPVPRELNIVDPPVDESSKALMSSMPPLKLTTPPTNSTTAKRHPHFSRSDYVSWTIFAQTTFAAGLFGWCLQSMGLFASSHTYWFAVFLVTVVLEHTSPAVHNTAQLLFPFFLVAQLCAAGDTPSWRQLALIVPTYLSFIGISMSVCLHRYFSHMAFETSRAMQLVLAIVSCFAYQGGALWWSAKHQKHHHFCDQPQDPHSAHQKGTFNAFLGWTMNPANLSERDRMFNHPKHLTNAPELLFLDKYYHLPVVILFTLLEAGLGYDRAHVAYRLLVPMMACRVVTMLFNIGFHPAHHEEKRCKSVNRPRNIMVTMVGEEQHEIHHRKPSLCQRGTFDIPYWTTIYWMEKVGLIWNCR